MALGLILPTEGEVDVLGEPVFAGGAARGRALRKAGALVEEPAFWMYLSGRRNLDYFAAAAGPPDDRDARRSRVDEVLRTVGLDAAGDKKVKAYSQGMRQRLGIGLALLGAPRVLLLDEPTNGLDPQGMREIRTLLRRLADDGVTVFVSSHLLSEVEAMCDRVGVLARGRLVAEGPPANLRAGASRLRIDVDDRGRAERALRDVSDVTLIADGSTALRVRLSEGADPAEVNAALVRAGVGVRALVPEHDSLEDVFVALVEGEDAPR
jgi:ABC-2 type transport system ATP-binding protein